MPPKRLRWYAKHKPNEYSLDQVSGPHDTDELMELLLNDDIPMETAFFREEKYVDWLPLQDLDEFPDKILNIMKDKHKENTSLRLLFLKHDSDGSATLDREELSNVLADLQFPCNLVEDEFKKIDTDKSGHIDFNEFHAYISVIAPQIIEHKLWFYIDDEGIVQGPVPQINLEYWGARKQLKPTTKVRREDYSDFHSMGPSAEFPDDWIRRADEGFDSEESSEEEEEIEYYCYTYMSPCPQSEFEMVDNIYDLKEALECDSTAVDQLKVMLRKTIENFSKSIKGEDVSPKDLPLQLFPYFVVKNCIMGSHMACSIESIGKALLKNNEIMDEIDNLLLSLEMLKEGDNSAVEFGYTDDEDNVIACHPDYIIFIVRFKNVSGMLKDWMYCLRPQKAVNDPYKPFHEDEYLPVQKFYIVPYENTVYRFLKNVMRYPYMY